MFWRYGLNEAQPNAFDLSSPLIERQFSFHTEQYDKFCLDQMGCSKDG
jgi:hypothetical protein